MLNIDLSQKVALVIGGSRGIGAAITETMCRAGAQVFFTHTGNPRNQQMLEAFLNRIRGREEEVEAVPLDARDAAGTAALAGRIVERSGKIDVLVANAGRNIQCPAEQLTGEEWRAGLELNLSSAFYAVRAVLPHMLKARYGRIILIGSSAAYDGGGGAIDYAAAKAGLEGMMRYLAKNYARRGILTNAIIPCVIETELLRERYSDEAKKANLLSQIPAGRLGQPADIAGMAAFLASSWGDYVCGQSLLLDGGRTLFR